MVEIIRKNIKERKELIWTAVLFVFNLFIYPPFELYLSNVREFWFQLRDIILPVVILSILMLTGIMIIGVLLPSSLYRFFLAIVLGIGLGAYIQGSYLNNNYGVLDGKEIVWSDYSLRGFVGLAIWLFIIVISFVIIFLLYKKIYQIIKYGCLLLVVMQISAIFFLVYEMPSKTTEEYTASTKDLFTYSEKNNIVVLCLDTFDSNYFKSMLNENREFYDVFKDFTFYDNTAGMFSTTVTSIPYILTGVPYENKQPYDQYLNSAYEQTEIYKELSSNDYDYGLYTDIGLNDAVLEHSLNGIKVSPKITSQGKFLRQLYKACLFKLAPQFLKSLFWYYTEEFDSVKGIANNSEYSIYNTSNFEFIGLLQNANINFSEQKQFKFIHLYGLHEPLNMNENMEEIEASTPMQQSIGLCNLVNEYIQYLKSNGIYDNSCIIILADHGINTINYGQSPLLLVKEFNGKGENLEIDSIPVSYAQLSDVFLAAVTNTDNIRNTIHQTKLDKRRFLYYQWDDRWDTEYMPTMYEMYIYDDVNDPAKIISTGAVYTKLIYPFTEAELNKSYFFKEDDESAKDFFLTRLAQETDYTWIFGKTARMAFHTESERTMYIKLTCARTMGTEQSLTVSMDGKTIYDEVISGSEDIILKIPEETIRKNNGNIVLDFYLPDAVSPSWISDNPDIRVLSLALSELEFLDVPYKEAEFNKTYSFKEDDMSANGFFLTALGSEAVSAWIYGDTARMAFHTESEQTMYVKLACAGTVGGTDQSLTVSMDGKTIYDEIISGNADIILKIPEEAIKENDGNIVLDFYLPDAISPSQLSVSKDVRVLSLALTELSFIMSDS